MGEKNAADVLEEAADLLLIRGRCRDGTYGRPGGPRCVVGAMSEVSDINLNTVTIYPEPIYSAWSAVADSVGKSVTTWSDQIEDDFEVIDTLRHIAKDLRNEAVA